MRLLIKLGVASCALLFFLLPAVASANPAFGYYGIFSPGWPCDASYQALAGAGEIRLAVLWQTFGRDTACLQRFLADPRTKAVEFHLLNEVCQKHGRCGPYEFMGGLKRADYQWAIRNKSQWTLDNLGAYSLDAANHLLPLMRPDQACYVSFGLESNLEPAEGQTVFDTTWAHWGHRCRVVWNGKGNVNFTVKEVHGKDAKASPPFIANLDGVDIDFNSRRSWYAQKIREKDVPGWLRKHRSSEMAALWIAEFNGLRKDWQDPRARNNWPSYQLFQQVARLAGVASNPSPHPPAPPPVGPLPPSGAGLGAVCPNIRGMTKGYLYKPESQDSGGTREGKPAFILRTQWKKKDGLNLYSAGGAVAGRMGYYGTYEGSGERYYVGWTSGSMQSGSALKAAAGGHIYIEAPGGICFGPVDPTQRAGSL